MRLEISLIFLGTIAGIRLLYEFRSVPVIGENLTTWAALFLVYPPLLHRTLRKLPLPLYERSLPELFRSLRFLLATTLILFPPFLIANHFYQTTLLNRTLVGVSLDDPLRLIALQLFFVALPEEIFFRGWLQPLIGGGLRQRFSWNESDLRLSSLTILLTACLFAASHSAIALRWWHFAIFFPGLVFGWLREKTGHLSAPILFHVASNLLVAWIGQNYR